MATDGERVGMLDRMTLILHLPSDRHLVTQCGLGPLALATVGPSFVLCREMAGLCPQCWRKPSSN
jgi:hypothetical protein